MTHIIGGGDVQPTGEGPIRAAIRKRKQEAEAKKAAESMQMAPAEAPEQVTAPAKDKLLAFTHADWVKIYEGMLSHTLAKVSERVTKLSAGAEKYPASYLLQHRLFTDRIANHASGAAAVVGVEISIRENGVARLLTRQTRFFRTILEFNAGKDQGLMECLQQVMEDFATLAVTTDIATRYEQQQNKDNQGSV